MIIISPYAKQLKDNKNNPKNYPYWKELISLIDEPIVQIGISGEPKLVEDCRFDLSLNELELLGRQCRTWIAVDSFVQHFFWDLGIYGIVLWGQSDPNIFGHPENRNLLKGREYLLEHQFFFWDQVDYRHDCWVKPEEIIGHIKHK